MLPNCRIGREVGREEKEAEKKKKVRYRECVHKPERQKCSLRLCEHLATLQRQEANEVIKSICADGDPLGEVICKWHDAMR